MAAGAQYEVNISLDTKLVDAQIKVLEGKLRKLARIKLPVGLGGGGPREKKRAIELETQNLKLAKQVAAQQTQLNRFKKVGLTTDQDKYRQQLAFDSLQKGEMRQVKYLLAKGALSIQNRKSELALVEKTAKASSRIYASSPIGGRVNQVGSPAWAARGARMGGRTESIDALARVQEKQVKFRQQINLLETKGVNVAKLGRDIGKLSTAQSNRQFGTAKKISREIQLNLYRENAKLKTIQAQNRALKEQASGYMSSPIRGTATMEGSPAWLDRTRRMGGPRSALNWERGVLKPGPKGGDMGKLFGRSFDWGGAKQSALLAGAFPLLFGQGPVTAAAGALGGGLGAGFGGQMMGFGAGIATTAVISQISTMIASTRQFAESLTSLDGAYDTAIQSSLFSSKEAEKRAVVLKQLGETEKLSKLLTEEYIGVLGKDGLAAMQELGKQSDILSREWGTLTTRMGAFVAGPMAALLKAINVVLGGVNAEARFGNLQGALSGSSRSRFDAIYEEERNRGARRRNQRGGGTYMQRVVSDSKAQELTIARAREEGLFNDLQGTFGGSDTGFNADIRSMELKIKYAKETLLLSDKQLKIESKIRELKGKDNSFDEAKYRQLATQLNQLEEQRRLYQQIGQTIKQGIVTAIESAITGAQSLSEVLRSITQTVGRAFLNAAINAGVGALTSSWGNTGNTAKVNMHKGGSRAAVKTRASGGYIDSPEISLVGEGGEAEYIIPESKMNDAMARYAGGARGDDVLAGGGEVGGEGGAGGASSGVIDVTFNSHVINDVSYVTYSDFQAGVQQAAAEGAKRGEQATLRRLQTSPSTRRRVGV